MPEQSVRQEQVKRQERAERILDAAAALILRWGYSKTTLDDIARQARVSKGTIYQHWKTRDELLAALLARERLKVGEDIRRRMEADPVGATLRGFMKNSMLALMENPLMRAVMSRDTEMLGKLANQAYGSATFVESMDAYKQFLEMLRAQGVMGTDMDIYAQSYILGAVWIGFLTINTWLPEEFHFSDEAIAEMLAETVQRALAPQQTGLNRADTPETTPIFRQYIERELHNMQEMHKEKQS